MKMKDKTGVEDDKFTHNMKTELFNIFLLGLCFCLVMGGYNTMGQTQVRYIQSSYGRIYHPGSDSG